MIKVQVIGDCHTARIQGQHINAHFGPLEKLTRFNPTIEQRNSKFINGTDIEVNFWGLAGYKCFGLDIPEDLNRNIISSSAEDTLNIPGKTDNTYLQFPYADVLDADLIMPWLGYVDCRNWIPKYNNADLVVTDYVESFLSSFPAKKFRFIEPFPQFKELNTHNYPSLPYEKKMKANQEFIESLSRISSEKGLMQPVSQSIVYDAVKSDYLDAQHARPGNEEYHKGTTIDALNYQYNEIVYKNLVEQIKYTVSQLF